MFSPHPWTRSPLFEVSGNAFITVYDRDRKKAIADVFIETEEDLNNARLILAAPKLYEVCKEISEQICKGNIILKDQSPEAKKLLDKMVTALVKAEAEIKILETRRNWK